MGTFRWGVALLLAVVFEILVVALPGPGRSASDPWAAASTRRRRERNVADVADRLGQLAAVTSARVGPFVRRRVGVCFRA
jgi:hypothetical protein